jgi:D-alanyl-D-alanine carboxypeptidase/D-alanyl-D-alanine-endopeptidase (penicillin-binding protein 4)
MRTRVLALVAAGALALGASPAWAYVPEKTPKRHLEASIRRTIALPPARPARPGILVLRAGRPVLDINSSKIFLPASLIKLATTTAAIIRFGPDHRFATRFTGSKSSGGVVGTAWLVGGGDPTLATRAYVKENYIPKPDDPIPVPIYPGGSPTIEQLAAKIRSAGVKRVNTLYVDDTLFDARRTQPGWIPDYLRNDPDIAYIDALTYNEGYSDLEGNKLLSDPALGTGQALKNALAAAGVTVTGAVHRGRAPRNAGELARVESPPLADIVRYTNRYSMNYPAEFMTKALGASFGGAGTTPAGVNVIRDTLAKIGIPTAGMTMLDGSGLSTLDRATPRMLGAILEWILSSTGAGGDALRASLPVAGGPGTLFKRMTRPPTGGNLRGKTGFIRHVRGMAGWVTPSDGVPLIYVALFNDAPKPLDLTTPLDMIGLALALFAGP